MMVLESVRCNAECFNVTWLPSPSHDDTSGNSSSLRFGMETALKCMPHTEDNKSFLGWCLSNDIMYI